MVPILLTFLLLSQTPASPTTVDPYPHAQEDKLCGGAGLGHYSKELDKCVLAVEFSDVFANRHLQCSGLTTSGKAPEGKAPAKVVNVIICTFDKESVNAKPK